MSRILTNRQGAMAALAQHLPGEPIPAPDMYTHQDIEKDDSSNKFHVYTTYNCDRILKMNAEQRKLGKNFIRGKHGSIKPIGQMVGRIPMIELLKFPFGKAYEYMNDSRYILKILRDHPEWRTCEGEI